MLVKSTRFGEIKANEEDIIVFPNGLIGFEKNKHWILLPDKENAEIAWLQATAQPQVALPLISPRKFKPDYNAIVSKRDLASLQTRTSDRLFILLILSKTGKTVTANLRGPIIINLTQRLGIQTVLNEPLPLAMPLEQTSTGSLRAAA
jgi:flagellar assembly factor FliW